jgi:hypothetical protein
MNRTLQFGILASVLVVGSFGCNPASLGYFLFRGDQKAPAEAKAFDPVSDKREVTVAILVNAPVNTLEFAGLDREIVAATSRSFAEHSRDKKPAIKVIEPSQLDKFKAQHAGWRSMSAADIGKELGADYAMELTITGFDLYEKGTGRLMYMGRATADVVVYETAGGREHSRYFVESPIESRPADGMSASQYKSMLIQRLALRLSWKHIPHVTDQRVSSVQ